MKPLIIFMKGNCNPVVMGLVMVVIFFLQGVAVAELTLASPFTDYAILQRNQPVPVWGTGESGEQVTVEFAGQSRTTVADAQGEWKVSLAALEASFKGRSLMVKGSSGARIELKDILVGEVWLCSGQSNMAMGWQGIREIRSLASESKHIRAFEVKQMVALTEQDRLEARWMDGPPKSAVAFSFAHFLQKKAQVPVGVIVAAWGSSSLEAWMPRELTAVSPHFKIMMGEFDADLERRERIEFILEKDPWSKQEDIYLRRQTNILYNAMIHPLIPYACQGVVWYQGERNTQSMFGMLEKPWFSRNSGMLKYGETLQHWMQSYRARWENEELDFLVVMLPGYHKPLPTGPQNGPEHPADHSWAWMRESQLQVHELPYATVANTIDLGDEKNIHPKDKLPIGERLARIAAREVLGMEGEAHGPMMSHVEAQGETLTVHFKQAEGLKTLDGKAPTAFWVADDSGRWAPAEAELRNQTVVLRSSQVEKPLYIRYAFAGKPKVNLVNESELPAFPFRTDSFVPKR